MPEPRPGLTEIAPFQLGETAIPGVAQPIVLASNECATEPSPRAIAAYQEAAATLRRYPNAAAASLRAAIGRCHGIDPARIVTGHGSEDLIALVARTYCGAGDEVVVSQYGYAMMPLAARIAGAGIVTAKARELAPDVDTLLAAVTARTRLLYLANPNNPTGACLASSEVARLHRQLPERVLLVLDAAYAEYVIAADYDPGLHLAGSTTNTMMLRTFSKAYGLAGLRVGWLYGPSDIVSVLDRVRPPTNIAGAAQAAATAAVEDTAHVAAVVAANAATRSRFIQAAVQLGLSPAPSEGNFVLVRFPDAPARNAAAAYTFLRSRGILARRMDPYDLPAYLRVTMGADAEITAILEALADFLA